MAQDLIRRVLMKLDKNYLPYEYFNDLELFKEVEIFDGVTVQRLPSKKGLYFLTKFKEGVNIIEHYHNSFEYFYIKKGKAIINGTVQLTIGDEFEFKPFEVHEVKVIEECEMYVQFIKDEQNTKENRK